MDPMIKRVAVALWRTMDCDVGRSLIEAVNAEDYLFVANARVDPRSYQNAQDFQRDYQCVEFLRKYPGLPVKVDRVAAAKQVWREAESQCFWTNQRLNPFIHDASLEDEGLVQLVAATRREFRYLIGKWTVPCEGKFGPGSTYHDKGKLTLLPDKLASCPTRTPNNVVHLIPFIGTQWASLAAAKFGRLYDTVPGDRFTTAPKNALTDRGITISPSINVYWQLAYGNLMKQRLKNRGLDLSRGQDFHAAMAQRASITGGQATVDVKTASDTMSKALVQLLAPKDWFLALSELRASKTQVDGKWVFLEKFSSMGNGYTFELETAIFAAICGAVIRLMGGCPQYGQNISVYGDDIIVDTPYVQNVLAALRFFGFEPNERKTFTDGPFRESCGGDFFLGVDVAVCRVTKEVLEPSDWIGIANNIRRIWYNNETETWRVNPLSWRIAQDQIPSSIRSLCRGPSRLGDLVIHDSRERWKTRKNASRDVLGVLTRTRGIVNGVPSRIVLVEAPPPDTLWVRTWKPIPKPVRWGHWTEDVMLASRVYTAMDQSLGYTGRDSISGYKLGWASVT